MVNLGLRLAATDKPHQRLLRRCRTVVGPLLGHRRGVSRLAGAHGCRPCGAAFGQIFFVSHEYRSVEVTKLQRADLGSVAPRPKRPVQPDRSAGFEQTKFKKAAPCGQRLQALFRRRRGDETIPVGMKPFSACGAERRKPRADITAADDQGRSDRAADPEAVRCKSQA